MKKLFIAILLLPVFWILLPKQEAISRDKKTFNAYIKAVMEEAAIPGLAIAKIDNGEATLHTFGFADVAQNRPVTQDTLFNIASISKPIMGVVLLQLVEQGKLDLDRDINDYLPFKVDNPKRENETITLRHLVTHTSGIADYYDVNSFTANRDPETTLEAHLKSLLTPGGHLYEQGAYYLDHQPGTHRKYSNLASALAGYLVETTTGESLAQYSIDHLFKPLGMDNTRWRLEGLPFAEIAVPYEVESCIPYTPVCGDFESPKLNYVINEYFNPPIAFKRFVPQPHYGNPQYPDGGVRTSIKELSLFLTQLLKNQTITGEPLLSAAIFQQMISIQVPETVSKGQRFFWRDNSMGLIGHMGSDPGVFAAMYFDPNNKNGFIILMNRGLDTKSGSAMKSIAVRLMHQESDVRELR
ncbi:serine hydrolase domain-containing protein [Pseudoalteromonas sp. OOF1S-7]|uniref:serine hydrolase domain-containing protein n=1 Tax=Pseudoalteromonas sp. OOF1S-7 TaxID=2917757 RepID=UPI001EF4D7F9|nr:serine hydrolase domain-containing protein [Pseudoalteromonas sp. OOF1S-7]MCG7537920.1 beta-lactamase family protein [Pseudoalteromonas sp. OOF1S-7]